MTTSPTPTRRPARLPTVLLCGLLPVVCCLPACGCGSGESYEVVPVSGQVTLEGKPIADVRVSFQPTATGTSTDPGPASMGVTDAEGRFSVQTIGQSKKNGAVTGKHRVTLTIGSEQEPDDDAGGPVDTTLPQRCRDGSLTFEVPADGTDKADFHL